ncbi:MAG: NAD+ kinase [Verrucomicrobia bacterium]|jgi:NAD+ kinase|nr:MAG: NAD+ kinase [Verrucomicrobiota bacterium]
MAAPRIGIVANTQKPEAPQVLAGLRAAFARMQLHCLLETDTAALLGDPDGIPIQDLAGQVDLLVLLGGDGTILHLAKQLGSQVKPIAAINIGTLGFLTLGTADQLDEIAAQLANRHFRTSHRSVIRVRTFLRDQLIDEGHALNEVSFNRGPVTRLVRIELRINGDFVTRYGSDGLIIATPTGSTAYSLSAGGPIIEPGSGVLLITPVCPHSLSSRPLVVSDLSRIEIAAPAQRDEVFVTMDGQASRAITPEHRFEIQRADFDVPLVTSLASSFFQVLRQKLDWSGSNDSTI